ncbi:MAG: asparagine synthase [Alphaproteobacteria bacterium]|nr:asparagine synthase [Alphaproteobacteria bacterium]
MIYAGLIHFNDELDRAHELNHIIGTYTRTSPTIIKKNSLILCYGKLSNAQDMDEIWENASSVLMGRTFNKIQQCSFEKSDFKNLSHLNKEEFLEKIWGKYVYINSNKKASQFEIVVDSTGQLPFFYYPFPNGNILFSSHIEIIFKVLSQKPEFNWTYLCSYLVYRNSSAIQTPFKNIYELPPACCLKITKNERKTEPFWDPLSAYKTSVFQERDAVNVLQATLKPWIEPYKNICVSLSGGLDSSCLVYCLKSIKKEEQKLSALNYFHDSVKSSNELIHARNVCRETGIELIEIDVSHSLPFDPCHQKQLLNPNKPFPGLISLRWGENIFDNIPSDGSCAFLSGHGSDHIFMRPPSKKSVADYILEKGLKGSKKQLKNITQFYRDPFFSILKENAMSLGAHFLSRRLGKRNPKNTQDEIPDWIRQEVRQKTSTDFMHPIYENLPSSVLPGKYEQIDALYEGLASVHVEMNQVNPTYYPFLYEPVVEFALSFPTYDLFHKGYDRYPLRKAASDHFKTETVWRRDKSQTTGIFQLGVKKNLEYVLDLCLEGQFVKQGFIDREELQKTIILIGNGDIKHMWPFMHVASVEIFLKQWEEKSV